MAVCNLFNDLTNVSGNFMLFSQYVEDITHNYANGDKFKVVPSKFVALNIDYSKLKDNGYDTETNDLNTIVPRFFQNCFENGCAYGRAHYSEFYTRSLFLNESPNWDSSISRNLFWNLLLSEKLINIQSYDLYNESHEYIDEIVYYGDVSMHSYNEHQGMGYNELYCYIPTDAQYVKCSISKRIDSASCDTSNKSYKLEGHNISIYEYPQNYYYNEDFKFKFEDDDIIKLPLRETLKYDINTIVVLYDVLEKNDNVWNTKYNCIPMGMYIAGNFDGDNKLTNTIVKHAASSYSAGTAYGLRICTRFTATPSNGILTNSEVIADDTNYVNMSQLMTGMNENLSRMREISKMSYDAASQHAELLSVFKNNKTNVPYVKNVNGYDCWFINGKYVSVVAAHKYASTTDVSNLFKQKEQL